MSDQKKLCDSLPKVMEYLYLIPLSKELRNQTTQKPPEKVIEDE
jgi:hypothetical protein